MRSHFVSTVSAAALLSALCSAPWAGSAQAQAAPETSTNARSPVTPSPIPNAATTVTPAPAEAVVPDPAQAPASDAPATARTEDVIVTGSRVVRNGFQSPTPTTVLGADAIQAAATVTVADTLNQLPAFVGSATSHTNNVSGSVGLVGVNTLNLRGLGSNRTLVLIDGQRAAGSDTSGALDTNVIPAGLIKRVDVVTGGASAAYGSDAVSGVVNFILDHDFTGVKLNLEGGITTYGDDEVYRGTLTVGKTFADGRGHVQAFGEYFHVAGIEGRDRPWEHAGYQTINNPAYGTGAGQSRTVPQLLVRTSVGLADAAPGGLITAGPLRGTTFGPGSVPFQLNYGMVVPGGQMIGGDWRLTNIDDLTNEDVRQTSQRLFGRASYDVADDVNVYVGGQYSRTDTLNTNGSTQYFRGAALGVSPTNPFLPQSVRDQARALGLTANLPFGTTTREIGSPRVGATRTFTRYNIGTEGSGEVFGKTWKFDAHFQHSQMKLQNRAYNVIKRPNLILALDAVTNPATNQVVCRSTLTNPTNGCVPINLFGTGVSSAEARAYVTGTSSGDQYIKQSSAEGSISGEPFSTWAGPVSIATGVHWRKDYADGSNSLLDQQRVFYFGNFAITTVQQTVKEVFGEAVVPLAKDLSWAQSLELNGAVRFTDYSLAGKVTTWKLGGTYAPIPDLRFRATRSRDIRAPSLANVSPATQSTSGGNSDPLRNNEFATIFTLNTGNPNLKPEIGNTLGFGAVVSPGFIPGLTMSVDYYKIDLTDAIATISSQNTINLCSSGERPDLCQFITRGAPSGGFGAGPLTSVTVSPVNIASLKTRGIDFEFAYGLPLSDLSSNWDGRLEFRSLATDTIGYSNINFDGTVNQRAGSAVAPTWRVNSSLALVLPKDQIRLTWRFISASKIDGDYIVCDTQCPVSTALHPTVEYNRVKANHNFDLSINHRMDLAGTDTQLYFVVQNLFNQPPPPFPGTLSTGFFNSAPPSMYDRIGRYFHFGVRTVF